MSRRTERPRPQREPEQLMLIRPDRVYIRRDGMPHGILPPDYSFDD